MLFLLLLLVGCSTPPPAGSQLADLLLTTEPCRVRLEPFWSGIEEQTVGTGIFAKTEPKENSVTPRESRFDHFALSDKPSPLGFGPKTLSRIEKDGGLTSMHSWRESLPSDAELAEATTVDAMEKRLGPALSGYSSIWGSHLGWHSSANWGFFTLKHPRELETLSIFALVTQYHGEKERRLDSLRVTRGIARPNY